jgi:hypothetical protein
MSKLSDRIANYRIERYHRAVSDQSWNFFAGRGWLRFLTVGSVVTSWAYFILSVAKWDPGFAFTSDKYEGLALIAMLFCYFGLRKALARIATAPAGSLDERDLELRNEAFGMAYLVIRRVGLAVVAALGATLTISGALYSNFIVRSSDFDPYKDVSLVKWMSDSLVELMDSGRGVWIILSVLITLTYCAYSFPLVILGWRQSLRQSVRVGGAPEFENFSEWSSAMKKVTMNFVRLMASMAIGFIAMVALFFLTNYVRSQSGENSLVTYATQFALGALLAWSIFVYGWSVLSMLRARHLYRSTWAAHLKTARRANLIAMAALPAFWIGGVVISDQAAIAMQSGFYPLGGMLSQLLLLDWVFIISTPSVSMVAASVARRMKPEEQVEATSSEVGN